MRQYLFGALSLLLISLLCIILWIGLLSVMVQPGHTNRVGAFTISRPVYLETERGRVMPVVVEDDKWITYTVRVRK